MKNDANPTIHSTSTHKETPSASSFLLSIINIYDEIQRRLVPQLKPVSSDWIMPRACRMAGSRHWEL